MTKESIYHKISKPGRYLGREFNAVKKDWDSSSARFALLFPDVYEIGMSHLGLQILYHILNREEGVLAERCYCPDKDAEKLMREQEIPLTSLESERPISAFDIIGVSLPYELCYSNILTIFDRAGIPFYSRDRTDSSPIVLGGGSCAMNPEPVADFFDAIALGDGEEIIQEVAESLKRSKAQHRSRAETIERLGQIEGMYIPAHYAPSYGIDGRVTEITFVGDTQKEVTRRVLHNLDRTDHLYSPLVPNAKVVHDRLGIEIARGCTRGCRFCQAGMIYRPVRERSVEQISQLAQKGIEQSGFEELALLSLSTGDYSCIDHLLPSLMDSFQEKYVSVSMPSMRVGTLSQPVMDQIKRVRKTGFTVAPEAGSDRLRRVINKGITEEDLLQTSEDAFALGWKAIKLYFMIGLPTETDEDVLEIAKLSEKARKMALHSTNRRGQITTSVGTFVPKPHTPFQWEEQLSLEASGETIQLLKENMPKKGVKLKYHDPKMSFLEGVFSRGDRRLSALLVEAWQLGARLDAWSDHFNLQTWLKAANTLDMDLSKYLRARKHDEVLPWDHLNSGIEKEFLLNELENGLREAYTPDCRYHGCQKCGLCDFKKVMPIVHDPKECGRIIADDSSAAPPESKGEGDDHFKYMVHYSRHGKISYLGHLEILQLLFRAIRRAKITPHYSKGFNPSPKISFGGALPVGMESQAEYFIMDLPTPLTQINESVNRLNTSLPEGLKVNDITLHPGQIPQSVMNTYEVHSFLPITEQEQSALSLFLQAESFPVNRTRKGKTKQIDLRPLINNVSVIGSSRLKLEIYTTAGSPGLKIDEILSAVLDWPKERSLTSKIVKISWQPVN